MWKKLLIVGMVLIFGSGAVYGGKPFAEQGGSQCQNSGRHSQHSKQFQKGLHLAYLHAPAGR